MNNALIIILYDHPWEHTTDYTEQTANILCRNNTVICYMQKEAKSLKEILVDRRQYRVWKKHNNKFFLFFPVFLIPFRRFSVIVSLNTWLNILILKTILYVLALRHTFSKKILWIFYPEYVYMIGFFGRAYISVYDCVDYHAGSSPYKEREKNIIRWEHELISTCTYFFVNSRVLYNLHKKTRSDIVLVPQGFRLDTFPLVYKNKKYTARSKKPIIGYIGGINYRLDYALLTAIVRKTPQYNYLFVGPIQENDKEYFRIHIKHQIELLFSFPNVRHLEYISKTSIPPVISGFDIAIIPYDTQLPFNKHCYPMKLFEYFYMGKPVIATPITELTRFHKFVKIGSSPQVWIRHMNDLMRNPWPEVYKKEQRLLAENNSWEKKISRMLPIIERG